MTGIEGTGAEAGQLHGRRPRVRAGFENAWNARPATLLFAAAVAVSVGVLLMLGSRLTFLLDDWEFLVYRRGFNADAILAPHGENIVIGSVLAYKALLATVGMDSALPFRVLSTAMFATSVVVLFVYLRRRVGEWPALAGSVAVLFLGAAWEDLLWPFQIGYFVSMASGLAMLLALERGDRTGDRLACALLTVSILFSSLGLPFAAGALVAILVGPREAWRRRAYVVAVPAALFALWWIGWGRDADSAISATNIATAPLFLVDGLASSISSLLGLATPRNEDAIAALDWGRPLLLAAVGLAGWRLYRLGKVPPALLVVATITAAFWLLAGINEKPGRDPLVSRYQYVGAVLLLLIAAELLRGLRIGALVVGVLFAVTALAVASNGSYLHQAYRSYLATSELERADLAALEIARDTVDPGFLLSEEIARTAYVGIRAGPYLSAVDAFGSPAYTPDELASAPEPARLAADVVLANALGVSFDVRPDSADASACVPVPPTSGEGPRVVDVPAGGAVIRTGPGPATEVRMRRFATSSFPVSAGTLPGGRAGVLEIPTDRSPRPWQLALDPNTRATVCALPS